MDDLIVLIVVGIVKLIALIFRTIYRILRGLGRLFRFQSGQDVGTRRAPPLAAKAPLASPSALAVTASSQSSPHAPKLLQRFEKLANAARQERARCAREEANLRLCEILDGTLLPLAEEAIGKMARPGEAVAGSLPGALRQLERLLALVSTLAAQRRDEERGLFLGEADALAESCFEPITHFAKAHDLSLGARWLMTMVASESVPRPGGVGFSGLAPIMIPLEWPTEIGWWPSLAHEVGHTVYRSLPRLDAELRQRFDLPRQGPLPWDEDLDLSHLRGAMGAWLEEIFADAWGVMMLGPAYLRTMIWMLADADAPEHVVLCEAVAGEGPAGAVFAKHPPAHLRVLLAVSLLDEMGQHLAAKRLVEEWRRLHPDAQGFILQTQRGGFLVLAERHLFDLARQVVVAFYDDELDALHGAALSSIPGLDWGPHQDEEAERVRDRLLAGQGAATHDARHLIAGAVLARFADPSRQPQILRLARAAIRAVGVSRQRLRRREDDAAAIVSTQEREPPAPLSDAILLAAMLEPPPGAWWVRAS